MPQPESQRVVANRDAKVTSRECPETSSRAHHRVRKQSRMEEGALRKGYVRFE